MSVKINTICRGQGCMYAYVVVEALPVGSSLFARVCNASGDVFPALISLLDGPDTKNRTYVLSTPLSKKPIHLSLFLRDKDGEEHECLRRTFHPSLVAFRSKINGVLRGSKCKLIRNYDKRGLHRKRSLSVNLMAPVGLEGDVLLLKGMLQVSEGFLNDVLLKVFDATGDAIGKQVSFLPEETHSSRMNFSDVETVFFSILIPNTQGALTVGAFVDGVSLTFVSLSPREAKDLKKRSNYVYSNAHNDPSYPQWFLNHCASETELKAECDYRFECQPTFSIVVPLYHTPVDLFDEMIGSVLWQTYQQWELILVNSTPENKALSSRIKRYLSDKRIKLIELDGNYGISENTRRGIEVATGDYLCFFDHDDMLEPDILFEYARAINDDPSIELLYCDEDKIWPDGVLANPVFKPDFNLDLLRDNNYICHMLTVKMSTYKNVEPSGPELDGAQDHDMALKIVEQGGTVKHIARVLYHWRMTENSTAANSDSKPYATAAGILAVQRHLDRLGIAATVSNAHGLAFRYKIDYEIEGTPLISIIVPLFSTCKYVSDLIDSLSKSTYQNCEMVIVAKDDLFNDVLEVAKVYRQRSMDVTVVSSGASITYGGMCNEGANNAKGEYLVFVREDVVIQSPAWLETMLGYVGRSDVGAVGSMLCVFDGTILEAGKTYVSGEIVGLSTGVHSRDLGYALSHIEVRDVAAISNACMATRRDTFAQLGGFDESYSSQYVDVDYCFKLREEGLLVVYTPEVQVCYVKSIWSWRTMQIEAIADKAMFVKQWSRALLKDDPSFNRNFSRVPSEASMRKFSQEGVVD